MRCRVVVLLLLFDWGPSPWVNGGRRTWKVEGEVMGGTGDSAQSSRGGKRCFPGRDRRHREEGQKLFKTDQHIIPSFPANEKNS